MVYLLYPPYIYMDDISLSNQKGRKVLGWYKYKKSFHETKAYLVSSFEAMRNLVIAKPMNIKYKKGLFYLSTSLNQLMNGLRASESIYTLIKYLIDPKAKREIEFKAFKHGGDRIAIIPSKVAEVREELNKAYLYLNSEAEKFIENIIKEAKENKLKPNSRKAYLYSYIRNNDINGLKLKILTDRYKAYIKANYGINTHSLRYIFIKYVSESNLVKNPIQLSYFIGHKKLETTAEYTQRLELHELYRSLFYNLDNEL